MTGAGSAPLGWRAASVFVIAVGTRPVVLLAILAIGQAVLPLLGLFAMQHLIDAVADGIRGARTADAATSAALLATAAAAGIALLGSLVQTGHALLAERHGRRLADHWTERIHAHAAAVELTCFDRPAFHDLLQRAGAEASQRPVRLTQDLAALVVALGSLGLMAAVLARVAFWLPLVAAAAALPLALARGRHARLRFRWHEDHVAEQRDAAYVGAVLAGRSTAKDVRAFGLARWLLATFAAQRAALRRSLDQLARRRARDELLVHAFAAAGLFGCYVVLVHDAIGGGLTIGALVLHAQAAQRAQNGVRDLLSARAGCREHRLFLRPVQDFLELPTHAVPRNAPGDEHAVAAEHVSLRHAEATSDAVHDVSFTVRRGALVALVGTNGSGKSSLLHVLAGLYAPTSGAVRRLPAAILLQDAALLEASVRDNLVFGHEPALDDQALFAVLDDVGLADDVRALPQGLATRCSRRSSGGWQCSVGQARRLLLARVLVRGQHLVLLDEPFASLDGPSVDRVLRRLTQRRPGQTIVVADHSGRAVRHADHVLWLDRGRLRGDGPPAVLRRETGFEQILPPS
jgi:ATP-binding cassette, subfamily B, bacterial